MNQNEPMDKAAKEPEEVRKAKEKAMRLLLQQDRTEKELRDRLYRAGFSETASEAAMQYVSGFGYLDDRRYAENYISFHKGRRSRKEISFKLKNKGVPSEILSMAMEGYETEDESAAIEHLIQKKIKGQRLSDMEYTQLNKITAYLARKGFSFPVISRVMREMKERCLHFQIPVAALSLSAASDHPSPHGLLPDRPFSV